MSDYLRTLIRLAEAQTPQEAEEERLQGEADEASSAQYAREKKIEKLIKTVFYMLGISLNDNAINYSEDDREASVDTWDNVSLKQLLALRNIADDIKLQPNSSKSGSLLIVFRVKEKAEDMKIV